MGARRRDCSTVLYPGTNTVYVVALRAWLCVTKHLSTCAQWEGHIPKGKVLNDFAVSVDIVPTVLELARVPVPAHMQLDGTSMLPFLLGTGTAHTPDGRTLHSSDDR
jgi:arylsulfatase A-like enzyme